MEQDVQVFCNWPGLILNCRIRRVVSNNVRLVKSHSRNGWLVLVVLKILNTYFQSTDIDLQNVNFRSFLIGLTSCLFSLQLTSAIALTANSLLDISTVVVTIQIRNYSDFSPLLFLSATTITQSESLPDHLFSSSVNKKGQAMRLHCIHAC